MPSEIIVKRLVQVKLLYANSRERFGKGVEIDTAQAILTLDNCFEKMLWIVLAEKDPSKYDEFKRKEYPPFQVLLNHIKSLKPNFDNSLVKELHDARNLVQHSGLLVSRMHAEAYFAGAETLLQSLAAEIGIRWQDISLAMLIGDKEVAASYRRAEEHLANKLFLQSAKMMIKAFEKAKENRQTNQFGSYVMLHKHLATDFAPQDETHPARRLLRYVDKLYADLEILKLGLDYKGWREYRVMLGTLDPDDNLNDLTIANPTVKTKEYDIILFTSKDHEIEEWLNKTMPFVLQSILQWQEKAGLFDL